MAKTVSHRKRRCSSKACSGRRAETEDRFAPELQRGDLHQGSHARFNILLDRVKSPDDFLWLWLLLLISYCPGSVSNQSARPTSCCIARLPKSRVGELIERYHRKHWQEDGISLSSRCFVSRITLPCTGGDEGWSAQELRSLPELTPPNIMPR